VKERILKLESCMRRIFLPVLLLAMIAPLSAIAQDFPKAEIFGGYSYFRANPEKVNLNGWNASITGNLTHWFGVEADVSGHYASLSNFVDVNSYLYTAGPRFVYRTGRIDPFAHFLIGASRAGSNSFGVEDSDYALAAIIGGGADFKLSRRFAARAQADYVMTRFDTGFGDERQNNFRFSAGLVLRLGTH
jgi:hypothetical protein